MNTLKIAIITSILFISGSITARAAEKTEGRDLFYTYLGPIASVGHGHVWYNRWINDSHQFREMMGLNVAGGVLFSVYVQNLSGNISIQYIYNFTEDYHLQHLLYKITGTYIFQINEIFSIGVGAGIFLETPPSNQDYQGGAGGLLPVQFIIDTSFDTKLSFNLYAGYGWYGWGTDSTQLNYGLDVAFTFKVGRN